VIKEYPEGRRYMRITLETTMMSGIQVQLILNAILLKETVRRNTGNIIYRQGIDQSHILLND
jgi:hypothetical protein